MKQDRITAVTDDGMLWCGIWDLENTSNLRDAKKKIQKRAEEAFKGVTYDDPVELDLEGSPAPFRLLLDQLSQSPAIRHRTVDIPAGFSGVILNDPFRQ